MERTIAVITGASSGLGKEFAKLLVRRKDIDEVWAIARRKDKLTELKQELGEKIIPFSVDLSDAGQIVSWQRALEEQSPEIRYLINDAGFAKFWFIYGPKYRGIFEHDSCQLRRRRSNDS